MREYAISGNRYEKMNEWWQAYVDGLDESLNTLERELDEAKEMRDICTDEWCAATDHYIDDLANAVYTIHEPRWTDEKQTKRIKDLKKRLRGIYESFGAARQGAGRA